MVGLFLFIVNVSTLIIKLKVKVLPITGNEGPEGE
jgi:hypothetical protein